MKTTGPRDDGLTGLRVCGRVDDLVCVFDGFWSIKLAGLSMGSTFFIDQELQTITRVHGRSPIIDSEPGSHMNSRYQGAEWEN
jgi:hypothetical protein